MNFFKATIATVLVAVVTATAVSATGINFPLDNAVMEMPPMDLYYEGEDGYAEMDFVYEDELGYEPELDDGIIEMTSPTEAAEREVLGLTPQQHAIEAAVREALQFQF